jgi:hypothetical protein
MNYFSFTGTGQRHSHEKRIFVFYQLKDWWIHISSDSRGAACCSGGKYKS